MSRDESMLRIEPSGAISTSTGWYGWPSRPVAWQIVSVSNGASRFVKDVMYVSTPTSSATTPDTTRSVLNKLRRANVLGGNLRHASRFVRALTR